MIKKFAGKERTWILGAVLLASLAYSALALKTQTAYASTCDCAEEETDAESFCYQHFHNSELSAFECPVEGDEYLFECYADQPNHHIYIEPCD